MNLLSRLWKRRRHEPSPSAESESREERRQRVQLTAAHVIADDADRRLALLEARVATIRRRPPRPA